MPFDAQEQTAHAQAKYSIRLAQPADASLLANILASAFQHDPIVRWILPSAEYDARFFAIDAGLAYIGHRHCWISAVEDCTDSTDNSTLDTGAACWLPPGKKPLKVPLRETLRVVIPMLLKFAWSAAKRGHTVDAAFERHRPQEPHYYLHMLGARQEYQGQGVGSALLAEGLRVVDKHNVPAYLESSNEANVALYERFGFKVQQEERLAADGPTVWYMWRPSSTYQTSGICRSG